MIYNILLRRIKNGGYKLNDMLQVIATHHAKGDISDLQREELENVAFESISIDNERPAMIALIQSISERVTKLEQAGATPPDAGETLEYPAWHPWDGISKDYQHGAIVTHNGTIWANVLVGQQNVWEPGAPGIDERFWREYVEGDSNAESIEN